MFFLSLLLFLGKVWLSIVCVFEIWISKNQIFAHFVVVVLVVVIVDVADEIILLMPNKSQ